MTVEEHTWRVGVIGMSPTGLFLVEQIRLASNMRLIGVFDTHSRRCDLAAESGCQIWDQPDFAITSAETDVVFVVDGPIEDLVADALVNGKHIVICQPGMLSSAILRRLAQKADASKRTVSIACLRRWSADFVSASTAKLTGRLGSLRSVRLSSCEMGLSSGASSGSVLREFGFHWLDQLLLLIESKPCQVFAKRFIREGDACEHGILAVIEFLNGCTAQIELQTQSTLSLRTGWILEGSTGSSRNDRLYTLTQDGEIVDEPLSHPKNPAKSFINELKSTWQGEPSTMPTLADVARVMELIELIERSAMSGDVVRP